MKLGSWDKLGLELTICLTDERNFDEQLDLTAEMDRGKQQESETGKEGRGAINASSKWNHELSKKDKRIKIKWDKNTSKSE